MKPNKIISDDHTEWEKSKINKVTFIGLGVQKGGTTTLHALLDKHPNACLPEEKETHYFSKNYEKGFDWYIKRFKPSEEEKILGEITPYYLFHPLAPRRIHTIIPNAKLIILLRDPVRRSISQYFHSKRLGVETLEIHEAFKAEDKRLRNAKEYIEKTGKNHFSHQEHSYKSRSRYEKQLGQWEEFFKKEQILIIKSEDLFIEPERNLNRIQEYIGLDKMALKENLVGNEGRKEHKSVDPGFIRELYNDLKETYEWAKEKYNITWDTSSYIN